MAHLQMQVGTGDVALYIEGPKGPLDAPHALLTFDSPSKKKRVRLDTTWILLPGTDPCKIEILHKLDGKTHLGHLSLERIEGGPDYVHCHLKAQ